MSQCGNSDCQWHKYCEDGLMWFDEDITECRHWIKPKPSKMKNIKVAETDYEKAVKVLKETRFVYTRRNSLLQVIYEIYGFKISYS